MDREAGSTAGAVVVLGGEDLHGGFLDDPLFLQIAADPRDGFREAPQAAVGIVVADLIDHRRLHMAAGLGLDALHPLDVLHRARPEAETQDGGRDFQELLRRQEKQPSPAPRAQLRGQFRAGPAVEAAFLAPPVLFRVRCDEEDVATTCGRLAQQLFPHEEVAERAVTVLLGIHVSRWNSVLDPLLAGLDEGGDFLRAEGRAHPAGQRVFQHGDHRIGVRVMGDALPFALTDLGDPEANVLESLLAERHAVRPGPECLHRRPSVRCGWLSHGWPRIP
nr:hypothetical protein [Streptomyces sp. AC602_WCS936]